MMRSFNWILQNKLAGAGRPGLLENLEDDLAWLQSVGIRHLVSLTQHRLELPEESELHLTHFPIPDMGIPTPRAALTLCEMALKALHRSEPVLLHCKAGLGRTGTMIACVLVSLGMTGEEAVGKVRNVSSYYIQSESQERFVSHYEEFVRELESRGELPTEFLASELL